MRLGHLSDVGDVRALAHKGCCNEVDVVGEAPLNQVLLILLSQCRQVHNDARQVDILSLSAAACMPVAHTFEGCLSALHASDSVSDCQ